MNEFQEKDLIAYHLQELTPSQARAIRRALKLNPQLAALSEDILSTLRQFDKTEETPLIDAAVLNRNWDTFYPSLDVVQPQAPWKRWRKTFSLGVAFALLTIAALYMTRSTQTDLSKQAGLKGRLQIAAPYNPASSLYVPKFSPTTEAETRHTTRIAPALSTPLSSSAFQPVPGQPDNLLMQAQPIQVADLPTPQPLGTPNPIPTPVHAPQTPSASPIPAPADKRKQRETDLSIGVFGDFTLTGSTGSNTGSGATANSVGRSQSALPSAGALVTFHQQFRPMLGYRVSTGYTQTTFNYTYGASNTNSGFFYSGGIGTHIVELTAAYVVQGPHTKRVSSFADVGGGMLTFIPTTSTENTSYVFRPAAVAGAGVDFKFTQRLALRTEFRAVSFRGPDFRYHNGSIPVTTRYTFSSEPTIGLTYQFGKSSK